MDQMITDDSAKGIEYVHLARVFQIDPRLAEFKKFFPLSMNFETALALKKQEEQDEENEVFVFEAPPRVEVSRAAHLHAKQGQDKETPLPPPQPVVNEISSEIEKMAIISPRPSRKSDATKRQTKISNFFRKSSS